MSPRATLCDVPWTTSPTACTPGPGRPVKSLPRCGLRSLGTSTSMPAALRASGDGVNAFDVAARLAEGRPAVDDVEQYVAACHRLGYQHQDLTMHSAQVRDWYGSEDGLD